MRSAMMELTGLDKVGGYTLLDNNGVQHITNRHAGGDGSADATMKNSADVARTAYVLNNFDHAYLSKNRADGYMTRNGKRAPIVIFEKKIDGSHVVVEAVCDTKKNTNYIVTEYLAKSGVDPAEVTKGLRSPVSATSDPGVYVRNVVADPSATAEELQASMDAASSPRDTSETLADLPSAETSIAPARANVNGNGVENSVETVKSAAETAADGTDGGNSPMWETYGMKAPKTEDQMEDVKTFDQALELAGTGSGMAANVNYVLGNLKGRNALEIAYTYGKDAAETRWAKSQLGGTVEALQGLGARENDIFMRGSKINLILKEHPEMTMEEIKRIPEILDDPILVLSSQNKGRAGSQNTRLVLFGSVKDGRPVLCVLDLQPVENRIVIQDMQKATSAYTKDNDPVGFVRNSKVLYTSENEKRTTALLKSLGFRLPIGLQRYGGSIGSRTYADGVSSLQVCRLQK